MDWPTTHAWNEQATARQSCHTCHIKGHIQDCATAAAPSFTSLQLLRAIGEKVASEVKHLRPKLANSHGTAQPPLDASGERLSFLLQL